MEKEFVSYDHAVALKELGFKEECLKFYHQEDSLSDDNIFLQYKGEDDFAFAPLYQQAFRFFREKYGMQSIVESCTSNTLEWKDWYWKIRVLNGSDYSLDHRDGLSTHELAESACLDKLIEIVKDK